MISTRWATPEDWQLSFVHEHVPEAVVTRRIADGRVAIAELDGQPIGALQLEYLWGRQPYIALIRVHPDTQRRGAGTQLVDFVSKVLRADGYEKLYSSSQADEPAPQAWHRRMGFVECGFIAGINIGGVGEVFFVKDLR